METFGTTVAWIFGLFWSLVAVAGLAVAYNNIAKWRKDREKEPPKRSEKSDDFMKEREGILCVIEDRMNTGTFPSDKELERLAELSDSSEFASLVRCAHYAGYHLTFEQSPYGGVDPEPSDPAIFKTDMAKAAASREEKKWARYRRY